MASKQMEPPIVPLSGAGEGAPPGSQGGTSMCTWEPVASKSTFEWLQPLLSLTLGLSIPCLVGRETGREQHQPHLCSDEEPLHALQGMPGGREAGGFWLA